MLLTAGALSPSTSASLDFANAPLLPHSMVLNLEMMSTVAATCAASNPILVSGVTRSQIRRGKRKHTLACLIVGMQQQRVALRAETHYDNMLASDDAQILMHSSSIHRADSGSLRRQIHSAGVANVLARQTLL